MTIHTNHLLPIQTQGLLITAYVHLKLLLWGKMLGFCREGVKENSQAPAPRAVDVGLTKPNLMRGWRSRLTGG